MSNERRVTIAAVIPAFNAENTVASSITSALRQTDTPEEVIVVDDGSSDETSRVVQQFGGRVRLIYQTNQGSAVARQTGTDSSSADYIAYLDADDWWPENKIEKLRGVLHEHRPAFLISDLQRARVEDSPEQYLPRNSTFFPWAEQFIKERGVVDGTGKLFEIDPENAVTLLLKGFPAYPSTMAVRRDVVNSIGGWDGRFRRCQDFDFALRIARKYPLHYMEEVSAIIGLHEGNDNAYSYVVKQSEGDIKVLKAHLEAAQGEPGYYKQVLKALGRKYRGLGYSHRRAGQFRKACQCYVHALRYPGRRIHSFNRLAVSLFASLVYRR